MKQYVKGCDQYQRIKNRAEMPAGKLRPNQVPERPWQHILVDFITKLPMSKGHDSILVVCDRFLKMSHFVAMTEKTMAEELARLFMSRLLKMDLISIFPFHFYFLFLFHFRSIFYF